MTNHKLLFALLGVFAIIQLALSQDQEGFISLDCGLSANEPPYTDSSNTLTYSSDAKFVEGGKIGSIQKHLEADYTKAYTTLRYFPDGIRNCYKLNVTKDTRYLVRASFVYGNYDGLDSHPTFDLYIGRTWWATISNRLEDPDNKWASLKSLDRGYGTSEEIIHTTWSNTLQVCLLKTAEKVPFISALELRPLSNSVYATQNGGSLKRMVRLYFSNFGTSIRLELRKTPGSSLPPLINAIEVFTVHEISESATYKDDVIAFEKILAAYALSTGSGDPCVPKPSHYLKCSNNTDTSVLLRIISLNLSSIGLSGIISPAIQNLTNLQVLDLSSNKLTGGVPDFLSNMVSLLLLNLSYNSLSGPISQALLDRQMRGLVLNLQGNPMFTTLSLSKKNFPVAVVASVASVAIVLLVLAVLFIGLQRKRSRREALRPSIETAKRRFSYSEVKEMTNNFQKILGEGGFGIIYHGHLNNLEQVAVKVLSPSSSQGYNQFKAEVELLMRVHHNNLVNLAGYCDERNHLALVYEYMENRDLKEHLSGKEGSSFLDWPSRLRIAAEAALGLEYLHTGSKPPMIHRDVKSTNILLNEDFQAKLGDFGLSRSFPVGSDTHVSTVVGTPGFLDPEYFQTHRLSEKSDVYSFGVVLLEITTNQLVIDQTRERPHIAEWVRCMLSTGDIESIMDPNLKGSYESSSAWKVLELAMSCTKPSSAERPTMAQIVHELNECLMYENSTKGRGQDMISKSSSEVSTSTQMTPMAR